MVLYLFNIKPSTLFEARITRIMEDRIITVTGTSIETRTSFCAPTTSRSVITAASSALKIESYNRLVSDGWKPETKFLDS